MFPTWSIEQMEAKRESHGTIGIVGIRNRTLLETRLFDRLRREPLLSSVAGSLPVLFFGDLFTASVATVGLNPSRLEYLDKHGNELTGSYRRFETLTSLGVRDRASLSDVQCRHAIDRMRNYFHPDSPTYSWFRALDRVTQSMGYCYDRGEVAHLDLSQEATDPTWSRLRKEQPSDFDLLQALDLPFLKWQIEAFPLQTVVCNGKTVFEHVLKLIGGRRDKSGTIKRLTWHSAKADIDARRICIVGWNLPLARPTGLGKAGEHELGKLLGAMCNERERCDCRT